MAAQTPSVLIQRLSNFEAIGTFSFNEAQPELWTPEDIERLTLAVRQSRWTALGVSFNQQWNRQSLQPIVVWLETSPFLVRLSVCETPDNRTDANRALSDLLLQAATRNPHRTLKDVHLCMFGSLPVLGQFITTLELTGLVLCEPLNNKRRSKTVAEGLGTSLERIELMLPESGHAMRVLLALTRLPNLKYVQLRMHFDRSCLLPALATIMKQCPIETLILDETGRGYSLDLSEWLARTTFTARLGHISLTKHALVFSVTPGTALDDVRLVSLYLCILGPGFFQALARFRTLKVLDLNACRIIGEHGSFRVLLSLPCLQRLDVSNLVTIEALSELVECSPHHLKLSCKLLSLGMVEQINKGLKGATVLKRLTVRWDEAEPGALAALGQALSGYCAALEEVHLERYPAESKDTGRDDYQAFLRYLHQVRVKSLYLRHRVHDQDVLQHVVTLVQNNPFIENIGTLSCEHDTWTDLCSERSCRRLDDELHFQLKQNRYGRRLFGEPSIPRGLWALVLARTVRDIEQDVMFVFTKALVGDLFPETSQEEESQPGSPLTNEWTTVKTRRRQRRDKN